MTKLNGKPCPKCKTNNWYDCGSCKECAKQRGIKRRMKNKGRYKNKDKMCEKCGTNRWDNNTGVCIECRRVLAKRYREAADTTLMKNIICNKCGNNDWYPDGHCRPCKRITDKIRHNNNKGRWDNKDEICEICNTNKWDTYGKCKECKSRYNKKRRRENPEHFAEIAKKSRLKHIDKIREKGKIYRTKNAVKEKARKAQYYIDNKEHITERIKKYNEENPIIRKLASAKRRTRIAENGGFFTVKEWEDVCEKYNHHCLYCMEIFTIEDLTVDHVIPVSKGGTSFIDNLQPLCLPCNLKKHTDDTDYRLTYHKPL